MKKSHKTVIAISTLLSGFIGPEALAHSGPGHSGELTKRQSKQIKDATKKYRHPAAALAAGFIATDECAELPGVGGMGYHYVNPANIADGVIDPAKPEILVYVPTKSGKRRLGSVEYFAPDADQNLATDGDRPTLFGAPFDGPMPGHGPGMPIHYDLHVWLFVKNPAGQLAAWNPRVTCTPNSDGIAEDNEVHDHDD
jgi:hypothetical protein